MKKIILVLLGIFTMSLIKAQSGLDTSVYNKLSESAKKEIQIAQATNNVKNELKSYTEIAGYGKEIGVAVRDGLVAIKDVTIDLSKSDVGKTTIWLIIWKVAGRDMLRIAIGILLMIVSIFLISRSYFRTFKRKICIKNNGFLKGKEYTICKADNFWEYPNCAAACHFLFLLVMFGVCALIMFV